MEENIKDRVEEYLKHDGSKCPFCKSGNIESVSSSDQCGIGVSQQIHCNGCGRDWSDIYQLIGIGFNNEQGQWEECYPRREAVAGLRVEVEEPVTDPQETILCDVCKFPVLTSVAHFYHDMDCPKFKDVNVELDCGCDCDNYAHPECCPMCKREAV